MTTWRWMVGMTDTNGTTVTYVCDDGYVEGYNGQMVVVDDDCVPDWNDPATRGCLLHQVRQARGESWYCPYPVDDGGEVMWVIEKPGRVRQTRYHSEADALLAALRGVADG